MVLVWCYTAVVVLCGWCSTKLASGVWYCAADMVLYGWCGALWWIQCYVVRVMLHMYVGGVVLHGWCGAM
jgi:hypothetical protein